MRECLIAFDQSPLHVGRCIFLDSQPKSWGEYEPDPPHYDELRRWMRDMIGVFHSDGYHVTVILESIYLKFYGGKPQVDTYQKLCRIQSHIWAIAREMGADVVEITPYKAMAALTGIREITTKSEVRKAAMIASASKLVGETVSEHIADSVGLGIAYLAQQAE